jgi:hypothetical protein
METVLLSISIIISIILFIKVMVMRKSIREIRMKFSSREETDSGTKIGTTSRDGEIRKLVSELNRTQEKMHAKYELNVQGDAELKRSIINVSHDLRTPLTAIIGYLDLIKEKNCKELPQEVTGYLKIIDDRAHYMKDLTDELFEYSLTFRDDIGEPLELSDVRLNQMVEDCLMDYYGALTEKGITPDVYITENEIVRKLNPAAVDRILSNLMSNALKYTADKLKIELTDDGEIRFSNNAEELNELNINKLFDRFYTVNTGKNSTGIGLSIVKALTEKMGGKISADYNDGMFSIVIRF